MQSKLCYFSEVATRPEDHSKVAPNCRVFYLPGSKQITVKVRQGKGFKVPVGAPVTNVFPLPEGLLLETETLKSFDKDVVFEEVLESRKESRDRPTDPLFSYFSLNYHPLNQMYAVRTEGKTRGEAKEVRRESISSGVVFGEFGTNGFVVPDWLFINQRVGSYTC